MAKSEKGKGANIDTRANPFGNSRIQSQARPDFAECARLGLTLDKIIGAGAGIILAATRDGGALVLTVLDGDTRHRTYCSTSEELEEALGRLEEYYGE